MGVKKGRRNVLFPLDLLKPIDFFLLKSSAESRGEHEG